MNMRNPTDGDHPQSLNDIQDYLASFNKEIQDTGNTLRLTTEPQQSMQLPTVVQNQPLQEYTAIVSTAAGDTIHTQTFDVDSKNVLQDEQKFIQMGDQQVYIQGEGDQPLVIAQSDLQYVPTSQDAVMPGISQAEYNSQLQDTQLVAVQSAHDSNQPQIVALSGQEHQNSLELLASASQQNQQYGQDLIPTQDGNVVIGTDGSQTGQYQTVTIVPSEVNQGGEVSYVLIVSNTEQEKNDHEEDVDLSVYDFKEDHRGEVITNEQGIEMQADTQKRIIKMLPKKVPTTAQLMCNYCNYTSSKKYLLTRHMKTHSEERPHRCNICDRGFKTVASLQNHVNTHTGTKPHSCKQCESCFTTSGELVRHVRYRHTHEKPHRCTECDYQSVELSKLKRHMRSHTGERPYSCPHCNYASPDTYKLKRHLRIHTGEKPYECDICHARFTQSNSLKAHRLIHSGEKPMFQCELCPTTCGRKTDLKIHIQKLHTSDKPLQCRKCAKSFPDRYTYKIHMKTHDGEKCYKCELCPYAALSERHLQSHILTHTGEKPFECVHCDQTFRQKQLLKRHLNLYHTPDYCPPPPRPKRHECSECDKCFAHKGNLLRHMALHDPESPMYQQLPPKTGKLIHADDDEDQYIEDDEDEDDDDDLEGQDVGQQKTVMIEVTQEGSDQQMFLLMEVPADGDGNQQAQLGETIEGAVPEGVEEAPDPSLIDENAETMDAPVMEEGEDTDVDLAPPVLEPETTDDIVPEVSTVTYVGTPKNVQQRRAVKRPAPSELLADRSDVITSRRAISPRSARLPAPASATKITRVTRGGGTPPKAATPSEEPANKRVKRDTPKKKDDDESKRREEQIRKDIEECFGFDMDDDAK